MGALLPHVLHTSTYQGWDDVKAQCWFLNRKLRLWKGAGTYHKIWMSNTLCLQPFPHKMPGSAKVPDKGGLPRTTHRALHAHRSSRSTHTCVDLHTLHILPSESDSSSFISPPTLPLPTLTHYLADTSDTTPFESAVSSIACFYVSPTLCSSDSQGPLVLATMFSNPMEAFEPPEVRLGLTLLCTSGASPGAFLHIGRDHQLHLQRWR